MSKKILALILILAAVSGILVYAGLSRTTNTTANANLTAATNTTANVSSTISVVINDGSQSKSYPVTVPAGTTTPATALSALLQAGQENNFMIDYSNSSYGAFVKSVNGLVGTDKTFWIYQLNGQDGQVASDAAEVKPGDTVTWKFTSSSAN